MYMEVLSLLNKRLNVKELHLTFFFATHIVSFYFMGALLKFKVTSVPQI